MKFEQLVLFDRPTALGHKLDGPIDPKDYWAGRDAGFRGDELVTNKSPSYMLGYDVGQVDKGMAREMKTVANRDCTCETGKGCIEHPFGRPA